MSTKKSQMQLHYAHKKNRSKILGQSEFPAFNPRLIYGKDNDWANRLYWADNLMVLRALKHDANLERSLEDAGGVKLVFIDPPFGTGDVYDAKGAFAYSAEMQGSEFIEFLRQRFVLLHDIMADDGSFYMKIDYHFGHYAKVALDEVFGIDNFRNEIVLNRRKKSAQETKRYNVANDVLLFYTKSDDFKLEKPMRKRQCTFCGEEKAPEWHAMVSSGIRNPPERNILGRKLLPPRNMHWTYRQERIDEMAKEGRIRIKESQSFIDLEGNRVKGLPQYLQSEKVPVDSSWIDLKGYTWRWKYPTEVAEEILHRVISSSSKKGDIVLDIFAGSGTTGAVAEKLGRKWIMADSSKMSIHVIIKRLFNLKKKIGNRGKKIDPSAFVVSYSEGFEVANNPPQVDCRFTEKEVSKVNVEEVQLSEDAGMPQDVQSQKEGLDYVLLGSIENKDTFRISSMVDKRKMKKNNWSFEIGEDIRHVIFKDVFGNSFCQSKLELVKKSKSSR